MTVSVLVVDNEPLVREAITDILDLIGINVVGVSDGKSGISFYRSNQTNIDLIILDTPLQDDLDGAAVLEELQAINPLVKVLVSSGYEEKEIARQFGDRYPLPLLKKPYDANGLISKVITMLSC